MKKLLVLAVLVFFVPYFIIGFNTDASVYAYMGKLVADGGIPYIDGWDHKGISLYLINAFGYLVLGFKSFTGIRILELLLILIGFLQFFNYSKRQFSSLIAFISGVFGIFTLRYFFEGGNVTEEYALILSLLSALILLKKNIRTFDYALIGAFFVVCFTIRANLIAFWIALFFVYIIHILLQQKSLKEVFLNFLKMGYGAVTVSILLFVYMSLTGSFNAFIDAAFTFNFSYTDSSSSGSTLMAIFKAMKRYHLSVILAIGFSVSLMRFIKDRSRLLELLLILWIPFELYLDNISHRMYGHYFLMWVPLIMFSVAVTLQEVKERFNWSQIKLILGSGVVFMLCYYIPLYLSFRDYQKIFTGKKTKGELVIDYIKENYQDETLLLWGNASAFYNELGKTSPIRFFYQSTFKYDTEIMRAQSKQFAEQVAELKPELIIDTRRNGYLALDRSNFSSLDAEYINNLSGFLEIIDTDYQVKEEKFGMIFYQLKNE
jgi:hypothetical protein